MTIYKVSCEFFIKAKDKEEAEEIIINDLSFNNFLEEHIIINPSNCKKEEIFNI